MNSMTKIYLDENKVTLRLLLGLHRKEEKSYTQLDALYDVLEYMQTQNLTTISLSSLQYALTFPRDDDWKRDFFDMFVTSGYLEEKSTKTKKTYAVCKSPFL